MNTIQKCLVLLVAAASLAFSPSASAQEAPDALVKRISQEVLDAAKSDKAIQAGNEREIQGLVESKILPHVNFEHMTSLAMGPDWRKATPEQQKKLVAEFRALLVHTYAGALTQIKDQQVKMKPMRPIDGDDAEVRTEITQPRGEPIQLYYRLEKRADGWTIYDISILGAWLVETYKGSFGSEISRSGIDGLIKMLEEKNKAIAAKGVKKG
jgi:phospholipid transport system substrate-binding protein